jgi:large subunit ribosomal protein L15
MMISDVTSKASRNKRRRRIGRGTGSGWGKTSTRGHKGAGQHAAKRTHILSEGGQMPLFRLLPKRGFSNARFRKEFQVVNVATLADRFEDGAKVTPEILEGAGLIRSAKNPLKILGSGEISKKIEVQADRFSGSAAKKIEQAGGKAILIGGGEAKPAAKKAGPSAPANSAEAAPAAPPETGGEAGDETGSAS